MKEKKCTNCEVIKKIINFSKNKRMKDGLQIQCKDCFKKYRDGHKEERKNYDSKRWVENKEYFQKLGKEYRAKNKDKIKEYEYNYKRTEKGKEVASKAVIKYRDKNKTKYKSHQLMANAISRGDLIRPKNCSMCDVGNVTIFGHHEDYTKPLDVIWLCRQCHVDIHKKDVVKSSSKTVIEE